MVPSRYAKEIADAIHELMYPTPPPQFIPPDPHPELYGLPGHNQAPEDLGKRIVDDKGI